VLLATNTLVWYGPGAAAAVAEGSTTFVADVNAHARATAVTSGVGSVPLAKPTRLRNRPATLSGVGAVVSAAPRGRGRIASTIKVNALSQDDVTGAVLESEIEPGLSLKEALRVITAALAGKATAAGGVVSFRDVNDTKDRITASVDGSGARTSVTLDASDA
jgi:hypothetical protein